MTFKDARRRTPPSEVGTMVSHAQWARSESSGAMPQAQTLERYCQALGITFYQLFLMQAIIEREIEDNPNFKIWSEDIALDLFNEFIRISGQDPRRELTMAGPILFDES